MPRVPREVTERQIAERAAEIRARWSERERRKRAGIIEHHWLPPVVRPSIWDVDDLMVHGMDVGRS